MVNNDVGDHVNKLAIEARGAVLPLQHCLMGFVVKGERGFDEFQVLDRALAVDSGCELYCASDAASLAACGYLGWACE